MQQHGMVNKNYDSEEDSNFDINFLKDIISVTERQFIEENLSH